MDPFPLFMQTAQQASSIEIPCMSL